MFGVENILKRLMIRFSDKYSKLIRHLNLKLFNRYGWKFWVIKTKSKIYVWNAINGQIKWKVFYRMKRH